MNSSYNGFIFHYKNAICPNIIPISHNKRKFNVPMIGKIHETQQEYYQYDNECFLLQILAHEKYIVNMVYKIETINNKILILERMQGDLIHLLETYPMNESLAISLFLKICKAVKHCHDLNVVHLDIKPDNILYNYSHNKYSIKLADFGSSIILNSPYDCIMSNHGTLQYTAPEILLSFPYSGKKADIWSLGIVFHVLLTQTWPYKSSNSNCITSDIKQYNIQICSEIPILLQFIIRSMISFNPNDRPNIDTVISMINNSKKQIRTFIEIQKPKRKKRKMKLKSLFSYCYNK